MIDRFASGEMNSIVELVPHERLLLVLHLDDILVIELQLHSTSLFVGMSLAPIVPPIKLEVTNVDQNTISIGTEIK
jgi:hypothetical protein